MKISALVQHRPHPAVPADDPDPRALRHREPPRETILGWLAALLRDAFGSRTARREAYLAASADMKDYERRLKAWDDEEEREQRFRQALWP